jgi:hypothetical protein
MRGEEEGRRDRCSKVSRDKSRGQRVIRRTRDRNVHHRIDFPRGIAPRANDRYSNIPRSPPFASLAPESQLIVILADYAFLYDIGRRDQGDQASGRIGSTRPGDFNIHTAG